ncbi:MAG: hypothetical protein GKR91_10225 [Pseudomonadales bacterium]|nr:hypothetical protein [Pseudomonadales bacterium]
MVPEQIHRGHRVEVVFGGGVDPLIGTVENAPHREETHERLGWIVKDDEGKVYVIKNFAYMKRLE